MRLFQVQIPKGIQNNKSSREPAPRNLINDKKSYLNLTLRCLPCFVLTQTNNNNNKNPLQTVFCYKLISG